MLANDLATVYDEKGRYNKAIRLAEKAIKIASETAPGNLATYKYNLGHILMHKGMYCIIYRSVCLCVFVININDLYIYIYIYIYISIYKYIDIYVYICMYVYIYIYIYIYINRLIDR